MLERLEQLSAAERRRGPRRYRSRGLILVVVLVVLALLGLMAACFSFQVNADYAATQTLVEKMQTRMAAEAGFQYVSLFLRAALNDVDGWYNNPEKFRGVVVWSAGGEPFTFGEVPKWEENERDAKETLRVPAYRFSIVADDPTSDVKIRYGITDEASKLNINTATEEQLTRLIAQVVPPDVSVAALVDALIDWRDSDETPRTNGAESDYYRQLKTPYRGKNAPFETVEELLMVRGFTGQVLYGEDADRNGLLSANENDAQITFPPDNQDGVLNRGLYPYLTVHSRDLNRANDNKPRIVLTSAGDEGRARLEEYFTPEETEYLLSRANAAASSKSLTYYLPLPPCELPTSGPASSNGFSSNGATSQPSQPGEVPGAVPTPFRVEDFSRVVDRCTLNPVPEFAGAININTAPPVVLRCLGALNEADVTAIVQKRATLTSEAKATTAWLLTSGALSRCTYDAVAEQITARGLQFTVEAVGYGDHSAARTRLQVLFILRGPVPQIVYYRDLTNLGVTYPLRRLEEEEWSKAADGMG